MRPAEFAAASAAALFGAAVLWGAAFGPAGAAPSTEATSEAPPAPPSLKAIDPKLGTLRLRMGTKRLIYIYAPSVPADEKALPILYFSGDWGWRPLQQETATYLAGKGRWVVGFDASEYFTRQMGPEEWAADLATLRSYVLEESGKAPKTQVLLIGFTFSGELIPYMLNRGGTKGFAGALLASLDEEGALIYRTSIQLKLPLPQDEVFDVGQEIHRLPPTFPIFLMDGSLDTSSAHKSLVDLVRGPKQTATIDGADRSFRTSRDAYFAEVVKALAWLEGNPGLTGH